MLFLLVLSLSTHLSVRAQTPEYSFYNTFLSDTPKSEINGVIFPRWNVQYRGQDASLYGLNEALHAFYGDSQGTIESPLFTGIKLALMNKLNADAGEMNGFLRETLCKDWSAKPPVYDPKSSACSSFDQRLVAEGKTMHFEIDRIRLQSKLNDAAASAAAMKILNDYFNFKTKQEITDQFLNYKSDKASHYPTEILFSTIYPEVSYSYGDSITVFDEDPSHRRAIDLNYYNVKIGNEWGIWGDAGEFITPSHIDSNQLIGYEAHQRGNYPDRTTKAVGIKTYSVQKDFPIEVAFYKYTFNQKTYILVFDGQKENGQKSFCLRATQIQSAKIAHCETTTPTLEYKGKTVLQGDAPRGALTEETPALMGVITYCSEAKCSVPAEVFKAFPKRSSKNLSEVNLKNAEGLGQDNLMSVIQRFKANSAQNIVHAEFHAN